MPQVAAAWKNDANKDKIELMVILGENNNRGKPTLDYCKNYASQHKVPITNIYIDYGPQGGFETLFTNIYVYPDNTGAFALPWEAILDGDNMEYMHNSSVGPFNSSNTAIQELLND